MNMYTDPNRIKASDPGKVEGNPVFFYLDAFSLESDREQIEDFKRRYKEGTVGDVEVKRFLTKVLNEFLEPIREKRRHFENDPKRVEEILKKGTEKARKEAFKTLKEVKKAMKLEYFND